MSKSVVVDAARNKVVAIFDNDTDPSAEARTLQYLATGVVPPAGSADEEAKPAETPDPSSTAPSSGARPSDAEVRKRLDAIIDRQEELLKDAQELRESLSGRGGG